MSKHISTTLCLLVTLVFMPSCKNNKDNVNEENPKSVIVPDEFEERLLELRQKIDNVEIELQKAEGLAQNTGLIDMRIAKYFAYYIAWEWGTQPS